MDDLISRQAAIDSFRYDDDGTAWNMDDIVYRLEQFPSAQPQTCEGCKHLGKWENEVEYGYPSPCTRCKRRANDNYEQ